MAVSIKVDTDALANMISLCDQLSQVVNNCQTKINNCSSMKLSDPYNDSCVYKEDTYDNSVEPPECNNDGYNYRDKASTYNGAIDGLVGIDNLTNFKSGLENYRSCLVNIQTAVENFDSSTVSLEAAMGDYDHNTWEFKMEDTDGDGVADTQVAYYNFVYADGKVYQMTVAEMVNSAYTGIGMSMSGAVANGETGMDATTYKSYLDSVNSFVAQGAKSNAFGVASKTDIENTLYAATGSRNLDTQYNSALSELANKVDYDNYLGNAMLTSGFAMGGAMLAALGLAGGLKDNSGGNNPGGNNHGGNNHGGNNPGGNNPGGNPGDTTNTPVETDPVDTDPEEPVDTTPHNDIEITTPIDDKEIPSELDLDLTDNEEEVNYDELARKEYENTDLEDINEYREDLINSINEKFDAGDLDSIKEKLSEYGYSEDDIAKIIEDRQSTITAILAGDEKQQLAEIAERLYKEAHPDAVLDENGLLKDFTSIYKQEPKYEDLVNGTENQLLINIEQNEDLAEYRDSVNNAHEDYKNEAEAANTAIAQAATAQTTMENLKSEYTAKYGTDDTKKWDEEAAKKYNESIESYNDSVNKAKDANAKAMDAKAKYEDAVDKYDNAKKELLDQVKEDNDRTDFWGDLKDDDSSGDTPGDTGGDTPGGTDEEVLNNFPDGDSTGDTPGDTGGDTTGGTDDETDLGDGEFDPNDPNSLLDAFGGDVKSEQVDSMTETLADSQTDSITDTLADSQTDSVTETLANSQTDSITESLSDESSEVGDSISDSNLNKNSDVSSTSVSSGSSSDTLLKADGAGESVDSSVSNTLSGNVGGNTGGSSSDGFIDNKPVDMKTSESSSSDTDETDERSEDTSKGIDGVEVISSGSDSIGDKIDSEIGTESNVPVDSNDEIENIEEMELPDLNAGSLDEISETDANI